MQCSVCNFLHLLYLQLIYYRLKAAHILVGKGGVCKLSGFGFQQQIVERNLYESVSNYINIGHMIIMNIMIIKLN